MNENKFLLRYDKNDSTVSFFCNHAQNEHYQCAFFGETFSLVDADGYEYGKDACFSANDLLCLVISHGQEVIYDLNGAFVAAVYDKTTKILRLINDRFGLIPVYVVFDDIDGILVTITIQDLKGQINLSPDYIGIAEYLSFDYCLEDRTFFKDVEYMLPGQEIVFKASGIESKTYYTLPQTEDASNKERKDYINELDDLYRHAISIRKADENTIGLTGGLDSRLILGILGGNHTHTYNFGNMGSGDEVGASVLAAIYQTDHHYLSFDKIDPIQDAREIIQRCDGQCPWERFYVLNSAKAKLMIRGAVEISGMGGDAISGQKSNFTGLLPNMGASMSNKDYKKHKNRLIKDITRGRIAINNPNVYGPKLTDMWNEVMNDYSRATTAAETGQTFGNYIMRLKLRSLERRVTASSMWITSQFLPIRFPIYDYSVMCFFNRIPQKYRFGQNLYIDYISRKYPDAAKAPHSETGHKVDNLHVLRTDYVTVRNYAMQKLLNRKSAYTNSFGFVNDKIRNTNCLKEILNSQRISDHGLFNISAYGDYENLMDKAFDKGGTAMILLKSMIQIALINEEYFNNSIDLYFKN